MVNEGRSWLTLDCRRGDCREDDRRFLRGELRESTCFEWNCLALTLPVGGWTERRVRNLDTCTVQCPPPTNAKARASVGQIRSKGNVENPGTVAARAAISPSRLERELGFRKIQTWRWWIVVPPHFVWRSLPTLYAQTNIMSSTSQILE